MKQKPGFCYEIFKNQAFWSHNNTLTYMPCSFYEGILDQDLAPDQSWYGTNHRKIIELVNNGSTIPGCTRCYQEEASGKQSRRQASAINYETFLQRPEIDTAAQGPEGLDYSVGNLCNLRCVICGPQSSTSWIPDHKKIYPAEDMSRFLFSKNEILEIENEEYLANVRSVHFHGGGEPLLSDRHLRLLEKIERVRGLSDVRVFYNTNGTQLVDDSILDIWSRCRLVELYFSIDDVGERFEYQRTGAKWHELENNIQWFYTHMPHNHMFKINAVWSYLNLYYLNELVDWHQKHLPANRYGDKCDLIFQRAIGVFAVNYLDKSVIKTLQHKFYDYPSLLLLLSDIEQSDRSHSQFWDSIDRIDSVRGVNFRQVCPEWSKLL